MRIERYVCYSKQLFNDQRVALQAAIEGGHNPKLCVVSVQPSWIGLRDEAGDLKTILMARRVRLFGADPLPETIAAAAIGRRVHELIDHPVLAKGTVGGGARIRDLLHSPATERGNLSESEAIRRHGFLDIYVGGPLFHIDEWRGRVTDVDMNGPMLDLGYGDME